MSDIKESTWGGSTAPTDFEPDILAMNDYYPFGGLAYRSSENEGKVMPARTYNSPSYRYGFNGMEKDDEMKENDQSLDFGARIYDPRLGRWMSVDPAFKLFPYLSDYVAFRDNPIYYVDPGGETLRVAGDENAREQARAALQKLTNDKVIVQRMD